MIKDIMKEAEHKMKSAIQAMDNDLSGVRTGRASPALVEHLSVEYYGAETPSSNSLPSAFQSRVNCSSDPLTQLLESD